MKHFFLFVGLSLFMIQLTAQIPAGYYNSATGSGYILKTQLHDIIDDHTSVSYSGLWSAYSDTDIDPEDGYIWDMYSENPDGTDPYNYTLGSDQCGNYSGENSCYNREHSFPKSWFNDASPMYTDIFHVVPTDGYVNGRRGNYPFGEVGSASWTSQNGSKVGSSSVAGYTGTVFEPIDEYKGDFARIYFYMATRYEDVLNSWSSPMLDGSTDQVYEDWALEMLLDWHNNDPVSQKEIDRNNEIYSKVQGNRNPFVDHPEYVSAIWGGSSTTLTVDLEGFENNFGSILPNTLSESSAYQLTGADLQGDVTITAPDGFQVSDDNSAFYTQLQLTPTNGAISATIYVRFYPTTEKTYSDNITHQSSGVTYQAISVQGIASASTSSILFSEDFNDCENGHQFMVYSIAGSQEWSCTGYGIDGTDALRMNGYVNGSGSSQNEDWLVSPSIDLTNFSDATFSFQSDVAYTGNNIEVFASSNFTGNVQTASWTQFSPVLDNDTGNDTWTPSGEISLSAFSGSSIVIAFKYTSTSSESARWTIDDVKVTGPSKVIWYGTQSTDAHTAANWAGGSLPTAADNVLIPSVPNQMVVSGDLAVNDFEVAAGGSARVLSGASLAIYGQSTINGEFKIQRNIIASEGYSIIGSPVSNVYLDDLNAELIYGYENGGYTSNLSQTHQLMSPGQGYFLSFKDERPQLTIVGTPNTGNIKRPMSSGQFELVSNPYTAAIDIEDFLLHNQNTIAQAVYFWDDGGQNVGSKRGGDFITVNAVGAVGVRQPDEEDDMVGGLLGTDRAMNGVIPSCQGVYVVAISNDELEFTTDMISTSTNSNSDDHFYRLGELSRILLSVQNEDYYNETLIGIHEDASHGLDHQFDAPKMESDYPLKIYSWIGEEAFAIQALPGQLSDVVSVRVTIEGKPGVYQVSAPLLEGVRDRFIYLKDLSTGFIQEFNGQNNWEITLTDRPKDLELLLSKSNLLSVSQNVSFSISLETNSMSIRYQSNDLHEVSVLNLAGKLLYHSKVQFVENVANIPFRPEPNQLYILRLDDQVMKFEVVE